MTADASGGVWTHALDLVRGLDASGVRVVLAVMGGPLSDARRREAAAIPWLTLVHRPYRLEWMDDAWDDVAAAGQWLMELAAVHQPDVVHVNGYAHAALPFAAPVVVAAHACVSSWFRAVRRAPPPASWHRYEQMVKHGLAAARLIVTPSRAMAVDLLQDYGPAAPVVVIANGRDGRLYAPAAKEPFVLTAGRLSDEAKNVATVAAAAPALPWPVYAAGEGSASLAGVRGLGELAAAELARWYSRAAIFALPATYEPFGLSVLEAALSGCALVLGDIASLRETWDDAACYVDPRSPDALVATVRALAADEPRRWVMAERALTRAQRYTAEAMSGAYLRVYAQLVDVPPALPGVAGRGAHTLLTTGREPA